MTKVFGRITASREHTKYILEKCFDTIICCYESADSGCSADHAHFIGESLRMKSPTTLRQKLRLLVKEATGKDNQYSIKTYKDGLDAEAYICKGTPQSDPEILINTYNVNVRDAYRRFYQRKSEIRQDKHAKSIWRELMAYIQEVDPTLFEPYSPQDLKQSTGGYSAMGGFQQKEHPHLRKLARLVGNHLYEWCLLKDKAVPAKFIAVQAIQSVIAHSVKTTEIKDVFVGQWVDLLDRE